MNFCLLASFTLLARSTFIWFQSLIYNLVRKSTNFSKCFLMIKNFLFPKYGSSRYFLQVLWQFLSSGFRFGIFGQTHAAAGGEMRPNYFKNRPPDRKLQVFVHRAAAGGHQIVRNSGRKNQLAILHFGKRKFLIKSI